MVSKNKDKIPIGGPPEKLESDLAQTKNLLEIFYDISTLLAIGPSLNDVLKEMFVRMSKRIDIAGLSIWLANKEKNIFDLSASYNLPEPFVALQKTGLKIDEGAPGIVFKTKKPYFMKEPFSDPYAPQRFLDLIKKINFKIESLFALPLVAQGEILGVFNVFLDERRDSVSRVEYILFYSIANQIASFIQNSRHVQELQE